MVVISGTKMIKRLIDILISLFALILFSPLFSVVAILIKLTDGGPVFYWQVRIGRYGREFMFPKFRSMVMDADRMGIQLMPLNQHKEGVTFKLKNDPRITWIGKIIRRFSIDEFPQLWSVLIGDMSLVGPRPPLPREVAQYTMKDRRRLEVMPGLTCIWQVSGRADIPFPQQVELDVQYIESQSLLLDIKLLLKTIPAVLNGRGAY
ncbi:MAG: sugar transferase [Candidatus Riflebacteria bacterium]|nr:sugar transferase [Candidatus Riflebacteria bacterium]